MFGITAINSIVIGFVLYVIIAYLLTKWNIQFEIGEKSEESNGF